MRGREAKEGGSREGRRGEGGEEREGMRLSEGRERGRRWRMGVNLTFLTTFFFLKVQAETQQYI